VGSFASHRLLFADPELQILRLLGIRGIVAFTILQRVSPDMEAEDVIQLEATWKKRLHTRPPHGLNDN
jgi:hypothetical protein